MVHLVSQTGYALPRQQGLVKVLHDNFVVVKINFSKENKNEKFLSKFPAIEGYPHFFVLGGDGKFLYSQDTGALESGKHHDPDKVLNFLKNWAPKREL